MLRLVQHRAYKKALAKRLGGEGYGDTIPAGGKSQKTIMQTIFVLMGRLAKIDGRVSDQEVKYASAIIQLLNLTPRQRQEAIDYFELGKQMDTDILLFVKDLANCIGRRSELAYLIMKVQLRLVYTKGCMRLKEKMLLRDTAELLGFDKAEFLQFSAQFNGGEEKYFEAQPGKRLNTLSHAYNTLQLTPDAADGEIRPAYLRLMTRYHPDKLMRENLSEETQRLAEEKVATIRTAYEKICGLRKLRA